MVQGYPELKEHPEIRTEIEREVNATAERLRAWNNSPTATEFAQAYGKLAKHLNEFLETHEAITTRGFVGELQDYRARRKAEPFQTKEQFESAPAFPNAAKADGFDDILGQFFEQANEKLAGDVLDIIRGLTALLREEISEERKTDSFKGNFWRSLWAAIAKLFEDRGLSITLGSHVDGDNQDSAFLRFAGELEEILPVIFHKERAPTQSRRALAEALRRAIAGGNPHCRRKSA